MFNFDCVPERKNSQTIIHIYSPSKLPKPNPPITGKKRLWSNKENLYEKLRDKDKQEQKADQRG
jgi:hypothetical protein